MRSQAQAEASELSRLASEELSALPRGIGDIHSAVSGRVFRALGPSAAPIHLFHAAITRGVYESVRGGLRLTGHVAGAAARSRTGETPLSVFVLTTLTSRDAIRILGDSPAAWRTFEAPLSGGPQGARAGSRSRPTTS